MNSSTSRTLAVAGLATAAGLTASLIPTTAEAATSSVVTGRSGAGVRVAPTTHSTADQVLRRNTRLVVTCWVVGGAEGRAREQRWYKYDTEGNPPYWLAAEELGRVSSRVKQCAAPHTLARTTTRLTSRTGPSRLDAPNGVIRSGAPITVVCKVEAEPVAGNDRWYYTDRGEWLSAKYLRNVGAVPAWCTIAR